MIIRWISDVPSKIVKIFDHILIVSVHDHDPDRSARRASIRVILVSAALPIKE